MLRAQPCDDRLSIAVVDRQHRPSAASLRRAEEIWRAEQEKRGGALFNGRVFSIERWHDGRIEGDFVDYMWLLAQWQDPALFADLAVTSLSVSGLLTCPDGVVFGRRGRNTGQNPGAWELVPSGGIDPGCLDASGTPDLVHQLLAELEEELGLGADAVDLPHPFVLVEDSDAHVVDIGFVLSTTLTGAAIRRIFTALAEPEYDALEILSPAALASFLNDHERTVVEVSRLLLQHAAQRKCEFPLTASEV